MIISSPVSLAVNLDDKAEDLLLSAFIQSCFIIISSLWVFIGGSALFTVCIYTHRGGVSFLVWMYVIV